MINSWLLIITVFQFLSLDVFDKTKNVDKMCDFAEEKSKSVCDQRKTFENNANSCQQWFSEVEVIMSADVRLSNLNVIEDQLQKVSSLKIVDGQ